MSVEQIAIGIGGILIALDVLSIGAIYDLAHQVGEDQTARERADAAMREARDARGMVRKHVEEEDEDELGDGGRAVADGGGGRPEGKNRD